MSKSNENIENKNLTTAELVKPIWNIQLDEKPAAYECFKYFRDNANYISDVIDWVEQSPGIIDVTFDNRTQIQDYIYNRSKKWLWKERKHAFLQYVEAEKVRKDIHAIQKMNKRLANIARITSFDLNRILEEFKNRIDSNQFSLKEMDDDRLFFMAIKAAETIIKIGEFERKVRGEPSEIIKNNIDISSKGEKVAPQINIQILGSKSELLKGIENDELGFTEPQL
jgi:hypothetical protein